MMTSAADPPGQFLTGTDEFTRFDALVSATDRWSGSAAGWLPAQAIGNEWRDIATRLDRMRQELARVLVVGVVGGTGVGKSTLVNALAGREVTEAGDVARPTTRQPVVVAGAGVDISWLSLEDFGGRLVRSEAAAVGGIVLIDCPDPDTQALAVAEEAEGSQEAVANHNRDRLEKVLPQCDVLLLVSTAQKYRSWLIARELAAFAPGRPLLFVQTHASRDPDIREDWRRELETQGFEVPRIFRLDAAEAAARAAAGAAAEPAFLELTAAIDSELVGRAARRVRRAGAFDLIDWFLKRSADRLRTTRASVARLEAGLEAERRRLEGLLAAGIAAELQQSRRGWQALIDDEVVADWQGGLFATFLHAISAIRGFWYSLRGRPGLAGRLLAGALPGTPPPGSGKGQGLAELGLTAGEIEQSRSVLSGLAEQAGVVPPLISPSRGSQQVSATLADELLNGASNWLAAGLEKIVGQRRHQLDRLFVRGIFELLFTGLLLAILVRAGLSFFGGRLWQGRPMDGGGFLQEAILWLLIWGFVLRWLVFRLLRIGLDSDLKRFLDRLPEAQLIDPLLADHRQAVGTIGQFLAEAERLQSEAKLLAAGRQEQASDLGRLRSGGDGRATTDAG